MYRLKIGEPSCPQPSFVIISFPPRIPWSILPFPMLKLQHRHITHPPSPLNRNIRLAPHYNYALPKYPLDYILLINPSSLF